MSTPDDNNKLLENYVFKLSFLFVIVHDNFFMNNKIPNSRNLCITLVPMDSLLMSNTESPRSQERCNRSSFITSSDKSLVHTTSVLNGL